MRTLPIFLSGSWVNPGPVTPSYPRASQHPQTHHFYLKNQGPIYGSSGMGVGRLFFQNQESKPVHFKKNNRYHLLSKIKTELSSKMQNFKKRASAINLATSLYINTPLMKSVVILSHVILNIIQGNGSTCEGCVNVLLH